jgi:hypothetical protein
LNLGQESWPNGERWWLVRERDDESIKRRVRWCYSRSIRPNTAQSGGSWTGQKCRVERVRRERAPRLYFSYTNACSGRSLGLTGAMKCPKLTVRYWSPFVIFWLRKLAVWGYLIPFHALVLQIDVETTTAAPLRPRPSCLVVVKA